MMDEHKTWRVFGWEVSVHLIAYTIVGLAGLVVNVAGPWLLLKLLPWAQQHRTLVLAAAFTAFLFICIILTAMFIAGRAQQSLLRYKAIAESCGIEGFHPLRTPIEKEAGWSACIDMMAAAQRDEVRVAVFTGASTFSYDPKEAPDNRISPLRAALDTHKGDLKILLMQTGCAAWERCIDQFGRGVKAKKYRIDLQDAYEKALEFCVHLASKSPEALRSIEVRTYDRPPLWKMVFMGNHMWLQHYIPGDHVDDRPAYMINCDVAGGIAHPLRSVFDYRWEMSKDRVVLHRDGGGQRHKWPGVAWPAEPTSPPQGAEHAQ